MASRRLFDGAQQELGLLLLVGSPALASGAYWIAHPDASWPGTPTGAQIAAGKLSNNNAAAYAGSEAAPTSGSGTITEATAITGLTGGTAYRIAWVVYDSASDTYSNVVVGTESTLAGAYSLTADAGAFSLAGQEAELLKSKTVQADAGAFALAGQDAALLKSKVVNAEAGAFSLSGQDAELLKSRVVSAEAGSYALSGQDATLIYTSAGAYTLTADAGAFVIAGQDASLLLGRVVSADAGEYALSGQDAAIVYTPVGAYTISCDAGEFVISGQEATFAFSGSTADTHDGFWSREWYKLKKREEKKPTIAEVVEIIKESPQVVEVVRAEVERKYPEVNYAAILANVQLQRFIAKQLIEAAEEEDDIEAMLIMA